MKARLLLLLMYLLSGACGLVYEVVWTRQLSQTLGITVFATSAVLAAFMAGLGLGSYLIGRRIDRCANPIRAYAWLEAGIGLYALLVPWILERLEPLQAALGELLEGHFLLSSFARVILAFLVFLIPATMMGGTVPAMGRIMVRRLDSVGRSVAVFYAVNTLGAVLGVLAAGFLMVGTLGTWGTTIATAAVNIGIGALLLLLRIGENQEPVAVQRSASPSTPSRRFVSLACLVVGGSGLTAMAYEVVWTRVLVVHLHDSTHAFSAMLAVFLFGLAAGNAILARFYDRIHRPLLWLGTLEVLIGLSVVAATIACRSLGEVTVSTRGGWSAALAPMFIEAAVVLLPGALLFGMTIPLASRIVCRELGSVGRDLGGIFAANTVGGILGSLAAGFLFIPLFGLRGTLLFLSALNVVLGLGCWLASTKRLPRLALCAAAVLAIVAERALVPERLFHRALDRAGYELIFYEEGITDTTAVWERNDVRRIVAHDVRRPGIDACPGSRKPLARGSLFPPGPLRGSDRL